MANVVTQDKFILDTAATITTDRVRIKSIRWVFAGATAGDTLVIKDNAGNTIWETVATGVNYVEAQMMETNWDGLDLTTIAGGRLTIDYGGSRL